MNFSRPFIVGSCAFTQLQTSKHPPKINSSAKITLQLIFFTVSSFHANSPVTIARIHTAGCTKGISFSRPRIQTIVVTMLIPNTFPKRYPPLSQPLKILFATGHPIKPRISHHPHHQKTAIRSKVTGQL